MGTPNASVDGETHCESALRSVGFTPTSDGAWPSYYRHAKIGLLPTMHVDDFKMEGEPDNMNQGCKLGDRLV